MYRAYKRTGIASYVRYACFKVGVIFSEGGYPETIQFCDIGYPGMAMSLRNFRRIFCESMNVEDTVYDRDSLLGKVYADPA